MLFDAHTPSLLTSLRKYAPGDGNDPLENFITEAFSWLLNSHPSFSRFFLEKVREKLLLTSDGTRETKLGWDTQFNLGGKRPDMICQDGAMAYIFEHKAWSHLHGNQLENYRSRAKTRFGEGLFRIILITANEGQHDQKPDAAFCWRHVYEWIQAWAKTPEAGPAGTFHALDFCRLLAHEGMGPMAPMSYEAIVGFYPSLGFTDKLYATTTRFTTWLGKYQPQGVIAPKIEWHGGRVGAELFPRAEWWPSLVVGFMVYWQEHRVPLLNRASPDFSIIADINPKLYPAYDESPAYRQLVAHLAEHIPATGFAFHHHLEIESNVNRWHPFHIRRSLVDVLRGTTTQEEQDERLKEGATKVLDVVLNCEAFHALRVEMRAKSLQGSPVDVTEAISEIG